VRAYVGQTRSRRLIAELAANGIGECTQHREVPPRRCPWFLDNGAFGDFKSGRPFDSEAFKWNVLSARDLSPSPDFIVCPDIVGGGTASLEFSLRWLPWLRFVTLRDRIPVYIVTQEGMRADDERLGFFDGIFVGGADLKWKMTTAPAWMALARATGRPCHIGRVGTEKRVREARAIGVDSIDSCLPLFSADNLRVFLRGLRA